MKKLIFCSILISLPFLLLLLFEMGLRLFSADDSRDPYVNVSPFTIFSKEHTDGVEFARITHRYAYAERNVRFPVQKPRDTIRIFLLGGSACAGWPHPQQETFSTYLQEALQKMLLDQRVEVINAAAHGFASFRVRRIFDDVAEMDPDAIFIYSGNNEFLEDREYLVSGMEAIDWLASRLRTVQWLRARIRRPATSLPGDDLKGVAQFFWKKVKRQALELRQNPVQFEKVQTHYRLTMEYMVRRAEERGIPILLATVPVNLRDWLPTVSFNHLKGSQLSEWQRRYDLGRKCLLEGRPADGADWMNQAIQMEPEHAESHFWLARLLEAQGRFSEALRSYSQARDLDYNPFRAISSFNRTLHTISENSRGVFLVDLEDAFGRASGSGIPGFNLFLDYVHPNTTGNTLIAREILHVITSRPVLPRRFSAQDLSRGERVFMQNSQRYDDSLDLNIQRRLFGLYALNHQYEAALSNARHLAHLLSGQNAVAHPAPFPESLPPMIREGCLAFERYETAQRKSLLKQLSTPGEMEAADRMLQAYYNKWFPLGTF
jgi:tetratricopeptide (TPR) repeat protein